MPATPRSPGGPVQTDQRDLVGRRAEAPQPVLEDGCVDAEHGVGPVAVEPGREFGFRPPVEPPRGHRRPGVLGLIEQQGSEPALLDFFVHAARQDEAEAGAAGGGAFAGGEGEAVERMMGDAAEGHAPQRVADGDGGKLRPVEFHGFVNRMPRGDDDTADAPAEEDYGAARGGEGGIVDGELFDPVALGEGAGAREQLAELAAEKGGPARRIAGDEGQRCLVGGRTPGAPHAHQRGDKGVFR